MDNTDSNNIDGAGAGAGAPGDAVADMPADAARVDPTAIDGGDAGMAAPVLDGVTQLLAAGGPVVAILLVLSVAALAIAFAKLWQFHRARLGDRKPSLLALDAWRAGRADEALAALQTTPNPVARVLACAMDGMRRGVGEARIREEAMRLGGDLLEDLRSYLRPLEVIATLAPLLGLFGTVLGMIEAFRRLSEAGDRVDPSILSGGIWEALLTTAVGLAVAIPAVALLNWFERRVERVAHDLDSLVTRIFTEDLSDPADVRTPPRPAPARRPAGGLRPAAVVSPD